MSAGRLRPIQVVGIGEHEIAPALLADLAERLADCLGVEARMVESLPFTGFGMDGEGEEDASLAAERLSSNQLVDELIVRSSTRGERDPATWTIAITGRDLYAPRRPFVFGEATLGGAWAVISTARFGAPGAASPRLRDRLLKEVLHEVAHLAGLGHCSDPGCPASPARRVAEVDRKNTEFCEGCRRQLFPAKEP